MNRLLKIFIFALPVLLLSFASDAALSVTGDDVTEAVRNAFVEEGIDENMDIKRAELESVGHERTRDLRE